MNVTRIRAVAAVAIAALALAACGTEITGSPVAGQAAPTTEAPADDAPADDTPAEEPVDPSQDAADETEPTADTSTDESTSSQEPVRPNDPADIDGATADWLRTFCGGFNELNEYTSPDTTGMTEDETIAAVVGAYDAMSQIGAETAAAIRQLPPPDFAAGDRISISVIDWFQSVGTVYAVGAGLIEDGQFADAAELAAAIDQIEAGLDEVNTELSDALTMMDEPTKELVRSLPECAVLAG